MDQEQTAPIGASDLGPHCLPKSQLTKKADDFRCDRRIKSQFITILQVYTEKQKQRGG